MHKNWTRRGQAALAVLLGSSLASATLADTFIDSHWLGGTNSWQTNAQWDNGTYPNNVATTHYNAFISSGLVTLATGSPPITVDSFNLSASANLSAFRSITTTVGATVDGSATVDGGAILTIGSSGLIDGAGTVNLGPGPGFGTLTTSATSLTIGDNLHVNVTRGAVGSTGIALVNRGLITGGGSALSGLPNGAVSRISFSTVQNLGTLRATGGMFLLEGSYARADLGNLTWGAGGYFLLGGTMQNTGATFHIASGEHFDLCGTISGGTINIDAGNELDVPYYSGATLSNVAINGKVVHYGAQPLNATQLSGNADFQLLGAVIEGPSRITSAGNLTIDSTVLVHGGGGFAGNPGTGSGVEANTVFNHGTLRSDNGAGASGEFVIRAPLLENDGKLATLSSSFLFATGNVDFLTGGVLDVQMSSTANLGLLSITGHLDLSAAGDSLALSTSPGIVSGTYYKIVQTGGAGVVGTFDSVTPNFELDYRGTSIWARYVPEPSAVTLTAALASMSLTRRRTRR